MKKLTYLILLVTIISLGCNNAEDKAVHIIERNQTINSSNAFNNLFLDSTAMESFINEQAFNDTLANSMRSFYNNRNYQYAWFSPNGFTEQTLAFRNLYDYELDTVERKKLDDQLDQWMGQSNFAVTNKNANFRKIELSLTWRYLNYLSHRGINSFSKDAFKEFPLKKLPVDSLVLELKETDPDNPLVQHLINWNEIKAEDFSVPAVSKTIAKNENNPVIQSVKKKLSLLYGYDKNDTTAQYNEAFVQFLKKVNYSFGYRDSLITANLVKELNVPVTDRLSQMIVNIERMQWLPDMKEGKHIIVNIPAFSLTALEGNKTAFDMEVVVGKEGSSTVMFTGNMNNIVFAPYWNIPQSIVKNEILPAVENDDSYLEKHQMEITGEKNGVPVIRQLPGAHNSLGKVKFLFPNSYNIYLHDTPNKSAFNRDERALSHGCIRVRYPAKLAEWVLADESKWNEQSIAKAMNETKEKWVKVNPPVTVFIYYLTSFVNEDGMISFRKDIYNHDERFKKMLIQ